MAVSRFLSRKFTHETTLHNSVLKFTSATHVATTNHYNSTYLIATDSGNSYVTIRPTRFWILLLNINVTISMYLICLTKWRPTFLKPCIVELAIARCFSGFWVWNGNYAVKEICEIIFKQSDIYGLFYLLNYELNWIFTQETRDKVI